MCEPNDFYLRVFNVLVCHRENIIPGNFGFVITKYQCVQIERKGAYV